MSAWSITQPPSRVAIQKVLACIALLAFPFAHASDSVAENTGAMDLAPQPCRFTAAYTRSREIGALPQPLQSVGNLLYDCDQGLIWQTREPVPGFVVYTTGGKHFRIGANNDVQVLNDLVNLEMADLLLAMMGGQYSELATQFDITREPGQMVLLPRQTTTARFLSRIGIASDGNGKNGVVITLVDGDGRHTVIDMDPPRPLPGLDPERCNSVLDDAETACRALLFPGQVAAGLTTDR